MLSLVDIKQIAEEPEMTDQEAAAIRDVGYGFAELMFDSLKNNQRNQKSGDNRGLPVACGQSGVLAPFVKGRTCSGAPGELK